MAKFNDFSQIFKPVDYGYFTVGDKEYKIKKTHTNALLLMKAQKLMQEAQMKQNRARTDNERSEGMIDLISSYEMLDDVLKIILGEKQFKTFKDLDLDSNGYTYFVMIINGLLQGQTYEETIEMINEIQSEMMGEQPEEQEN